MHFDNFCLFLLNCFAQFYCFSLMIDSERILGVREPEGFTRQRLSCPAGTVIELREVKYGYRVSPSHSHRSLLLCSAWGGRDGPVWCCRHCRHCSQLPLCCQPGHRRPPTLRERVLHLPLQTWLGCSRVRVCWRPIVWGHNRTEVLAHLLRLLTPLFFPTNGDTSIINTL